MGRRVEHVGHGPGLHDATGVHDGHPVGDLGRHAEIVPEMWRLSPRMVRLFILGSERADGLDLEKRTVQRALLDLHADPALASCSDLLWMLRHLLPPDAVRPIMGERRLGQRSIQESWDLALGRSQRAVIELGYEGVTVEQVLEQRLRRALRARDATAAVALAAVEDGIRLLDSPTAGRRARRAGG